MLPSTSGKRVRSDDAFRNHRDEKKWKDGGGIIYITDRLIGMRCPSDVTEDEFRNSIEHNTSLLEKRHHDQYKVFHISTRHSIDPAIFKNRMVSFKMTDHHPPGLEIIASFCREVHEWLCEDPRNVVAVIAEHLEGRTGVMICAYLSYCLFYPSPRQNMDYYSIVGTRNNKGVTIPSQRRYIYYYDHLRKHELNYFPLRVQLVGIYIERPPRSQEPISKDVLSVRVANGDVLVYDGDPMNISDETWQEEDVAWAGNIVSFGRDSYDPSLKELVQGCDVISRRAYGWTIPASNPVFLEGDVRVDFYYSGRSERPTSQLAHIWFNTMFTCPGACGGDPYLHGDEAHPYPDGETTSEGGTSEPVISVGNAANSPHRCSNPEAISTNTTPVRCPLKFEEFQISTPPGLQEHCSDESLKLIYTEENMEPPRNDIGTMLKEANEKGILKENYNERRRSVPHEGEPVNCAPDGRPTASGPNRIVRNFDEHVSVFPIMEIDGAFKNQSINNGLKVYIVTRCIEPKSFNESEEFMIHIYKKQLTINAEVYRKNTSDITNITTSELFSKCGAERTWPPVIKYGDGCKSKTLQDHAYLDDRRAYDERFCKYFTKQRSGSLSKYPSATHFCPMTGQCHGMEEVLREDLPDFDVVTREGNKNEGGEQSDLGSSNSRSGSSQNENFGSERLSAIHVRPALGAISNINRPDSRRSFERQYLEQITTLFGGLSSDGQVVCRGCGTNYYTGADYRNHIRESHM